MKSSELIGKRVVIAPFSTDAVFLYHQLRRDGVEVAAFMDKDVSLHKSSYLGTMIIPYFHFEGKDMAAVIAKPGYIQNDSVIYHELIAVNYCSNEIIRQADIDFCCRIQEIREDIDLYGLSKIRNADWIHLLKRKIYEYTVENGFSVHAMNLVVTTRCTLKCKGCCALMDYFYPSSQRDMDLEKTMYAYDMLMEHVDYIDELVPIGGETFLHKDMDRLLLHVAKSPYTYKIGRVLLITNGTIIPSKSTMEILGLHADLFQVALSDYGASSSKRLELVSLLNQYGCDYQNHVHDIWYLTNLPTTPLPGLKEEEIREKCQQCDCRAGGRLRIVENKVYSCHFVAFAAECRAIPQNRLDYLDVDTDEISKERLREFVDEIHPGMAYCNSPSSKDKTSNILIPVGKQIKTVQECVRYE